MRAVFIVLLCTIAAASTLFESTGYADSSSVIIISDDQQKSTQRSIKGVRQTLERSGLPVRIEYFVAVPGGDNEASLSEMVRQSEPRVLVTIGSRCTKLAMSIESGVPVVFASVLNPVTSGLVQSYDKPGDKVTGASLDIDLGMQIERFRELVPSTKKLGIFYSDRTKYIIEQARDLALDRSVQIIGYEISSQKDVPRGIDSLTRSCDGILAIPDELIYTPQSTRFILLESFRSKVPVMGFSPSFVKSGALFALIVDHKFVGVQAGLLVVKVLKGIPAGLLAVTTPEAPYLYINRNTAEKMRLDIPSEYYSVAKEVYE